jgi:hypothetical protein
MSPQLAIYLLDEGIQHFFPTRYFLPGGNRDKCVASSSKESKRTVAQGLLHRGTFEWRSAYLVRLDGDRKNGIKGGTFQPPEVIYEN